MTFDDAMTIMMASDGLAIKTHDMSGYFGRVSVEGADGVFGLALRYRSMDHPFVDFPVFPVTLDEDGNYVVGSPSMATSFSTELVTHLFSDDWYVSTVAECEDMLDKVRAFEGLTFTAVESNSKVALVSYGSSPPSITLYKSLDRGITWSPYFPQTSYSNYVTLNNVGDTVCFKAGPSGNAAFSNSTSGWSFVVAGGNAAASGNAMSILDASMTSVSVPDYGMKNLFGRSSMYSNLTAAPSLPATSVGREGYYGMFYNCDQMTSPPPSLPASSISRECYSCMFYGCDSLLSSPAILATQVGYRGCYRMFYSCSAMTSCPETLPSGLTGTECFYEMFKNCYAMSSAPLLPATSLTTGCYEFMFSGCRSLASVPSLPATSLPTECYSCMFEGCRSITSAPELPATAASTYCYYRMFEGCTSLSEAPELPATSLSSSCYGRMFYGCTSLSTAPALPVQALAASCYTEMFRGCTSLASAPELPATTLQSGCYANMFNGCSSLSYVEIPVTAWNASAMSNWLAGVSASGTFRCKWNLGFDDTITRGASNCPSGWTVETIGEEYPGLKFTSEQDGATVRLRVGNEYQSTDPVVLKQSFDGLTWTDFTEGVDITLDSGKTLYLRATAGGNAYFGKLNGNIQYDEVGYHCFNISNGAVAASGNVMSLLDSFLSRSSVTTCCFYRLFGWCSSLTSVPNLPATTLGSYCYYEMFYKCFALRTPPSVLPATSVPAGAYGYMFSECTSFVDCSGTDIRATYAAGMNNMFSSCTRMTKSPILHIVNGYYEGCARLFSGCKSLSVVETYQTAVPQASAGTETVGFGNWLYQVASTGTFICHNLTEAQVKAASGYPSVTTVPSGWTIVGKEE